MDEPTTGDYFGHLQESATFARDISEESSSIMAWVKSVSVEGLAGRRSALQIDFNRDVNVLWGVNGCGKTSLLKIIHSALRDEASSLVRVPFESAEVTFVQDIPNSVTYTRSISRRGSRAKARVDELLDSADADAAEYAEILIEDSKNLHWITKPRTPERRRPHFTHRYLPISRVTADSRAYRPYYIDRSGTVDEALLDRLFADDLQSLWRDYSAKSSIRISEVQREGIASILQAVIQDPSETEALPEIDVPTAAAYSAIDGFFSRQGIPFSIGTRDQFARSFAKNLVLRQVVAKVLEIQDKTRTIEAPMRKVEDIIHDVFSGDKKLTRDRNRLGISVGRNKIALESLSSGERQMLRILMECLAAGGNAIIIDEPELSMHVDWQYHLINSMREVNPDAQIIAATHSPEVMAELNDSKIFELVAK